MRFHYFFAFLSLLFIVSCSPATISTAPMNTPTKLSAQNTSAVTQAAGNESAYPAPTSKLTKAGYPAPIEETATPFPTIDSNLGIVKGELYLKGEPLGDVLLFLSDVYKDNQGNDSVVSIDYNTKNRAVTKKDGSFTFVNIPAKRYALVLVVIPESYLLLEPKDQTSMLVDVAVGKTVDMGRLNYDDLPVTP
jgi:hypothetical protein